jgi:hypothetical protein
MASLHAGLNRDLREALSKMAGGSQDDLGTVALASAQLIGAASNTQYQGHVRQLQPCLRLLLQAAGWLYPCFMPSSRLNPIVQAGAQQAWASCMCFVQNILQHQSLTHMPGFLALVQPHTNPQVPGEYPSLLSMLLPVLTARLDSLEQQQWIRAGLHHSSMSSAWLAVSLPVMLCWLTIISTQCGPLYFC